MAPNTEELQRSLQELRNEASVVNASIMLLERLAKRMENLDRSITEALGTQIFSNKKE